MILWTWCYLSNYGHFTFLMILFCDCKTIIIKHKTRFWKLKRKAWAKGPIHLMDMCCFAIAIAGAGVFISVGWVGSGSWAIVLWGFEIFLKFPNFLRCYVLDRLATFICQFITNNNALFHLWWKESLLNHKKVPKYCCLLIFFPFYVFITALIVENSHILVEIYLSF